MLKEIIETGKTVDAAIDAACEKLGCERDACKWEIIDLPKKTFLGLKVIPAKVRVSVEVPEPEPVKPAPQPRPQRAEPAKKIEKQEKSAPTAPRQQTEPRREKPKEQRSPAPPVQQQKRPESREEQRTLITEGFTEKEALAVEYIEAILKDFSLAATLKLYREQSGMCINIEGEGLGTIIGRRGETLDAIQYLTGLVANRLEGDYQRVTVDCGDYRTKRKETLEALARKLAAQVLKTNVSKTLEPMNPFERRVIHATVSTIEGVSSMSIGEEPNRRVVITSPTARRPSSRGYSRDGGNRGGRGGHRDRDRDRGDRDGDFRRSRGPRTPRPAPPEGPPKQTPESAAISDAPYGKLDLE